MNKPQCPSCRNDNKINIVEKIYSDEIIAHYNATGLNIEHLFKDIPVVTLYECKKCGLKYFYPVVLGDDAYYSHLQKEDWYFIRADRYEYEYASTLVQKNNNVLDIGCGRGVFSKYIDCNFYQGLEFSTKAIDLAKEDKINVISQTIEDHSLEKSEFYDVVTMFEVLEHLYDIDEFLKCAIKCLKIGGKLVISVPNNDGFIKKAKNNFLNIPPHHELHWNEKSLKKLSERFPLKVSSMKKEKVANIHKEWFWIVQSESIIRLGRKFKSLGRSKKTILGWLVNLATKPLFEVAKKLDVQKYMTGQGIVIVFEKIGEKQ